MRSPSDADVVTARTNINGIRWNHLGESVTTRTGAACRKRLLKAFNMLLDFRVLKLDVRKPALSQYSVYD